MAELPKDAIYHYHSDDGIIIKVDTIPLVRCGECKWWHDSIRCGMYSEGMDTTPDWFCADGERKVQE